MVSKVERGARNLWDAVLWLFFGLLLIGLVSPVIVIVWETVT